MTWLRSLLWTCLICSLTLGLALSVSADQTDGRLERLFERLQEAPNASIAAAVEQRIWAVWMEAPDDEADELMERGVEAIQMGELTLAIRFFNELVDEKPEFAEAWNKRATVHYMLGNYSKSMSDIEKTLELEPRHFGALAGLGSIFAELDQPAAAIRVFEAVLEIHPQSRGSKRSIRRLREEVLDRAI